MGIILCLSYRNLFSMLLNIPLRRSFLFLIVLGLLTEGALRGIKVEAVTNGKAFNSYQTVYAILLIRKGYLPLFFNLQIFCSVQISFD